MVLDLLGLFLWLGIIPSSILQLSLYEEGQLENFDFPTDRDLLSRAML